MPSLPRFHRLVRFLPLLLFAFLPALTAPTDLAAQESETGTIEGLVTRSGEDAAPIRGAVVLLEADGRSTRLMTDHRGRFRFVSVPEGEHRLTITHPGMADAVQTVRVASDEVSEVTVRLEASAIELEGLDIRGARDDQVALLRQRNALNVTTQIATNAHGHVPDGNLAEVMKRLPGVTPTYDFGEVTNISIRGIDPNRNAVTVDGARLPSTGSAPGGRGTRMDQVPGEFIRTIEVVKAPTPDMDADAIGGSANMVTKSGLEFDRRTVGGSLGSNYTQLRSFAEPTGTLYFANTLGEQDRLGVLAILSHGVSRAAGDITQQRSRRGSGQEDFLVTEGPERITSFRIHDDVKERTRSNLNLRLDFESSPRSRFYLNTFVNRYEEEETMRLSESYGFTEPEQFGGVFPAFPGLALGGEPLYNPEYEDNPDVQEFMIQQQRASVRFRSPSSRTFHLQPGFSHERGAWELDGQASWSYTRNRRETLRTILMLAPDPANGIGIGESVWRLEENGSNFPEFTQIGGPDAFDIDNYNIQRHVFEDRRGSDELRGFSLNARRALGRRAPVTLQAGVRYRGQRAGWDQTGVLFEDGLTDFFGFDLPLTSAYRGATGDFLDTSYRYDPVGGRYRQFPWPDPRMAEASRRENPELWIEIPNEDAAASALGLDQSDIELSEDVQAGYLMGEVRAGPVTLLGGVRVERTAVSGQGVLDDPSAETLEERFGQRVSSSRSYTNILPGVHVRWEAARDLLVRGSATRTLARPSFGNILPQTQVITFEGGLGESEVPGQISQNNVGLEPQLSDNLDLSLEYYFGPRAFVSVGAFRKDIQNFITGTSELLGADNDFGSEFEGYAFQTQINANSARVRGVEFSWQQQFTFLPGFMGGLGAFANGTLLETRGDYADGAEDGNVPGFTPRSGNVGLSWENRRVQLRANMNYRGETLTSWDQNRYIKRRYDQSFATADLGLEWRVTPWATTYVDVRNVFDEQMVNMKAPRTRAYQAEAFGRRLNIGLRAVR
ncbi:MAG: TonB-dependent receptor [Gemmatimonadales bacterium]|nr:MAG: TonB-dependent receptor [Gemmatimonadales bacterium]